MRESNRSVVSALLGSSSASTTWCYSSVVTVSFSINFKPCLSPVYSPPFFHPISLEALANVLISFFANEI